MCDKKFSLEDTLKFMDAIKDINHGPKIICLLEVYSLFTSVPPLKNVDFSSDFTTQSNMHVQFHPVTDFTTYFKPFEFIRPHAVETARMYSNRLRTWADSHWHLYSKSKDKPTW